MKALREFFRKQFGRLASSFSWTEKLAEEMPQASGLPNDRQSACYSFDRDERNQTGILTSGLQPRSRLPGLRPVACSRKRRLACGNL